MSDTKISALQAVVTPAAGDEFVTNQGVNPKKMTLAQIHEYLRKVISGESGVANQNGVGTETWQTLSANSANNASATIATVMTTTALVPGTYYYRYEIIAQSAATTNSVKFSVDATGTVTKHLYSLYGPSAGVTAATGAMDQEVNATTGNVWSHQSTRADNTTLGPYTDIDTANADIRFVIEGWLVTSTVGNLLLGAAGESTNGMTVRAGTSLLLRRVA